MLIQEFDISIVDKTSKANVAAKYLSWLHIHNDPIATDDNFPYGNLFVLAIQNPWYADIANFLTTGKILVFFSTQARKLLVEKSFN